MELKHPVICHCDSCHHEVMVEHYDESLIGMACPNCKTLVVDARDYYMGLTILKILAFLEIATFGLIAQGPPMKNARAINVKDGGLSAHIRS